MSNRFNGETQSRSIHYTYTRIIYQNLDMTFINNKPKKGTGTESRYIYYKNPEYHTKIEIYIIY